MSNAPMLGSTRLLADISWVLPGVSSGSAVMLSIWLGLRKGLPGTRACCMWLNDNHDCEMDWRATAMEGCQHHGLPYRTFEISTGFGRIRRRTALGHSLTVSLIRKAHRIAGQVRGTTTPRHSRARLPPSLARWYVDDEVQL
ncbi:hypothetical protein BDY17DRAFT_294990 [Neohortaea acidophila]|uniref:Uncharacterized protein n=1 Tax=Neohortaea acidophila TaxID=245834 RepID=A0A6A6PVE0_9PEZI|nr:uncharacterized protein BDY17DRAFT_294990 [Neohortaea acidophila]KAF2484108.1 hypothetical protein BDY17DRAFT_294990 [Neohortaea acidophila]